MKIAAVVVGLFVSGLAYLSVQGWIDLKWMEIENATRTTLTSVEQQVYHVLNNAASQFGTHSSTISTPGLPIAVGFVPGLMIGFKRGKRMISIASALLPKSTYGNQFNLFVNNDVIESNAVRRRMRQHVIY